MAAVSAGLSAVQTTLPALQQATQAEKLHYTGPTALPRRLQSRLHGFCCFAASWEQTGKASSRGTLTPSKLSTRGAQAAGRLVRALGAYSRFAAKALMHRSCHHRHRCCVLIRQAHQEQLDIQPGHLQRRKHCHSVVMEFGLQGDGELVLTRTIEVALFNT